MEFSEAAALQSPEAITTSSNNWTNITKEFLEAVAELDLGELMHDESFGLYEAMSAIEMMDPKMDAGMLCNRGGRKVKAFDEALMEGMIKLDDFDNTELIGIIDTTFACMVSWLEGHSLAQTVFTNLFLHKPFEIENRVLKVFCIFMYKLLEIVKDIVHKAAVYEEEDFQPMQYGYVLTPDISEQRLMGMLREVEEEVHRQTRLKSSRADSAVALYVRIKFCRVFYQSLQLMTKKKDDSQQSMTAECQRMLTALLEMLVVMKETIKLGLYHDKSTDNFEMYGFEPLINQRLLPPTFPRYTKIKSRVDAFIYFEDMIERFRTACKVQSFTYLHQAMDFFIEFSKSSPCILSRSTLQLLYLGCPNTIYGTSAAAFKETLRDAAKTFISPPALMLKSIVTNQPAKMYVDSFITHCVRPFVGFLQLCGHNRARQRDKLARLLEEFSVLQDEAERVDAFLHNISVNSSWSRPHLACFGTWILYHTLRIMIMYLMAGFELELYSVHEYYYIYWYLYEFLYGWLVSALTRADSFLAEQELINELHKNKNASKKKAKGKKKNRPYSREIVLCQALQNMCGGYYKALVGFQMDKKLSMPNPEFDNERVRYEHRFAPFQALLTPPPVQYAEFKDMTSFFVQQQQPSDSMYLYITGCKHFYQARQLLESIHQPDAEVSDLIKIAKTNFIVLKLLAGGHKKESMNPPDFDFSVHKYFPIIKLL